MKQRDDNGIFDLPTDKTCRHPEHNPPTGICIPQGKGYKHVCPGCGESRVLIPVQFSL